MQVIEKVKVVPEGYNGAGMNYDGCNRRDVNGKANAGLTLGIIGTALGAWALFGNRRSSVLGGAGGGMLGVKQKGAGKDRLYIYMPSSEYQTAQGHSFQTDVCP